jgi:SAM-dependent methyltransferase
MAYKDMKFEGDYLAREYVAVSARLDAGEAVEQINPVKVYRHRHVARALAARLQGAEGRPSLLEVGCGASLVVHEAAKLGVRCHGVDMNETILAYCGRLRDAYGSDVEFSREDGFALPFADRSFDLVFSVGMLEHYSPEDQVLLLKEQRRVARRFVQIDVPNEGPDSSMRFLLQGHEDSHLPTDLAQLATAAGLVDLQLDGRGLFVPRAGTERNSAAYQQFLRARFPQFWKDFTAADIEPLIQADDESTKEERMRYGSMHYIVGRAP